MRVLIDCRLISDKDTGISNYIKNLVKSYIERDCYSEIILLVNNDIEKFFLSKKVSLKFTNFKTFLIHHMIILSFDLFYGKYDIVHFPTYCGLIFSNKKIKIINTVHDVFYSFVPQFFSKNQFKNLLAKKYFDFIIFLSLLNSKIIFSVSNSTKKDLKAKFNKKSITIYNGCELRFRNLENKSISKKNFYLYVGNLRKHKNIDFLIDIFKENPKKKLIIAGNYKKNLKKNHSKNIEFVGYKSHNELNFLYNNAIAFILPSLYEGFGLPILEAIKCNTVVFSSNRGSLKELKNPNIYYFDPERKRDLNLLLKRRIIFKKNFNEKKYFNKFSWKHNLAKMHKQINS